MKNRSVAPYLPVGRCLRVALTKWPPYVDGWNPNYTGWCIEMFDVILESLNICPEYLEPPDGLWGAQFPNGSWFGMMGMLHRREVDVAIGPFGVTLARTAVADFSVPITATDHAILYRRPQIEPDLLGFTKPFTLVVWAGVLASLVVVTGIALGLLALSPAPPRPRLRAIMATDSGHHGPLSSSSSFSSTSSSFFSCSYLWEWLWGYRALLSQPVQNFHGGEGARVMAGLWLLTSLIIAIVYRSNLKAMLIVPKVRVPFDSLAELVEQREVPWTMAHGSIVQSFFESAYKEDPGSTMGRGWKGRAPLLRSAKNIIPTVTGGTAGLYTRHSSTYLMGKDFSENGYCRLALTRGGYMAVQHSMGFPLGSPLKPVLDKLVYRMMEFGLVHKFIAKEMANTSYCLLPPGKEGHADLRALALGDFLGVLTLYGAGVLGSLGLFVAEVMHR